MGRRRLTRVNWADAETTQSRESRADDGHLAAAAREGDRRRRRREGEGVMYKRGSGDGRRMRDEETNGERVIPRLGGFVDRSLSLRGGRRIAAILIGQWAGRTQHSSLLGNSHLGVAYGWCRCMRDRLRTYVEWRPLHVVLSHLPALLVHKVG